MVQGKNCVYDYATGIRAGGYPAINNSNPNWPTAADVKGNKDLAEVLKLKLINKFKKS